MSNKNNLASAHALAEEKRAFNRAVVYSHLNDGPCFITDLVRKMNLTLTTITEYCNYLEKEGYARSEFSIQGKARFKVFFKTDKENYPWPASVKKSANIQREYFDKSYPGIHKELLDAIYDGRISPDVIKSHRELNAPHWEIPKKDSSKYARGFQSSLSGVVYNG